MIVSTTKTIARLPHLTTFLADRPGAVVGWGRKPSGRRAIWLSRLLLRPLALLEDGFIRSVERHAPPLSLLVDDLGVYYDASRPSRIEHLTAQGVNDVAAARADELAVQWRAGLISKYNHAEDYQGPLPDRYVLVVDQIAGDLSVIGGLAQAESFPRMLAAALTEYPDAMVVVKTHPDVHSKAKKGYFSPDLIDHPRIQVIGSDCHCTTLIKGALAVYCVTSLMGFEGMLWNKPVRCFGMPFYAGWGLTEDEHKSPSRRGTAPFQALVHAALVAVARYADPDSGAPWQPEDAIAHVAKGRTQLLANRRAVAAT